MSTQKFTVVINQVQRKLLFKALAQHFRNDEVTGDERGECQLLGEALAAPLHATTVNDLTDDGLTSFDALYDGKFDVKVPVALVKELVGVESFGYVAEYGAFKVMNANNEFIS